MRKSKQEAAETRQRIIASAASEFRRQGVAATGLAEVMAAAGLTHGGFYRHFASKGELVTEACTAALATMAERMAAEASSRKSPRKGLKAVAERYLSTGHRDNPSQGCPLAALGSELARAEPETRETATDGFLKLAALIADGLDGVRPGAARTRALAAVATLVGALTMSRIVTDEALSEEILRSAREQHSRRLKDGGAHMSKQRRDPSRAYPDLPLSALLGAGGDRPRRPMAGSPSPISTDFVTPRNFRFLLSLSRRYDSRQR